MANFAYIENNQVIEVHDLLPDAWRNVSGLNLLEDWNLLNSIGWYRLRNMYVAYDSQTQYISGFSYSFEDNNAYETPIITDYSIIPDTLTEEQVFTNKLVVLRNTRDELLAKSDWTELPSVQSLHNDEWKSAWALYRQQLRNLPNMVISKEINIDEVTWPIEP